MENADRRQARRYDVAVHVQGRVRMAVDLRIINVSLTGIAAESQRMLRIGNHYVLRVDDGTGFTELDAVVSWCHLTRTERVGENETRPVYRVGLDFRHVLEERAPELQSFVGHAALVDVERRIFGRFRPRPEASAVAQVEQEFTLRRISISGMQIETAGAPPPGSEVDFEMSTDGRTLAASGRVSNFEKRGDRTVVGIGFDPLSPETRESLDHFIGRLIS